MPGPESVDYIVAATATTNVPSGNLGGLPGVANQSFTPGALPQPLVDSIQIQNGQYFLLTRQTNETQNGIWFADPAGPVPVPGATVAGGINPNISVQTLPGVAGSQNGNTLWAYSANPRGLVITPGEGTPTPNPGFILI